MKNDTVTKRGRLNWAQRYFASSDFVSLLLKVEAAMVYSAALICWA